MSKSSLERARARREQQANELELLRDAATSTGRMLIYLVELMPDKEIRVPLAEAEKPQPDARIVFVVDGDELVVRVDHGDAT